MVLKFFQNESGARAFPVPAFGIGGVQNTGLPVYTYLYSSTKTLVKARGCGKLMTWPTKKLGEVSASLNSKIKMQKSKI